MRNVTPRHPDVIGNVVEQGALLALIDLSIPAPHAPLRARRLRRTLIEGVGAILARLEPSAIEGYRPQRARRARAAS